MTAALQTTGLRSGYGRTQVLHGIDLCVPAGAVVAVLGANGAGKTTLLRTLAGQLPAMGGRVVFQGYDVSSRPAHVRSRAGLCLIPEGRGIFRDLTVRENLTMFAGAGGTRSAVDTASSVFPKLGQRLDQTAGTMSGGEQQMLALSRALVTGVSVVMADELSVGLAPVAVDEIFLAIDALRERGVALLIVEQYVDRVLEIADYVYLLNRGAVALVGEPQQLMDGNLFEQYLGATA